MAAAPSQAERKKCWFARDLYWKCLDENNDDKSKCLKLREQFENTCSLSWVKYFDRRKGYLKFKDKMENDGYEPIDGVKKKSGTS
ncbi:cytochrome c oxidase assembly factor 6 homolog [Tubulanus polymorphus]|uniref:cytochrome c oxidase assembly factor 6 homolog n=1 Tax=Tubulanus polymorphus TaxID=672921 RepID=UPI003DA5718E